MPKITGSLAATGNAIDTVIPSKYIIKKRKIIATVLTPPPPPIFSQLEKFLEINCKEGSAWDKTLGLWE